MVDEPRFAAAIGNFDGVHRGHQFLLDETLAFAREKGWRVGVVLFDPHPRRFFDPACAPFLITPPQERDELLRVHGAQQIFSLPFDQDLSVLSPQAFVENILADRLGLAGIVAGADFRFGAKRAGDGDALKSLCEKVGIETRLIAVKSDGTSVEKLSSSAVRQALREGAVQEAAEILGRRWAVCGAVVEGEKRGRMLGFPTANMTLGELIEPREGVYAVSCDVDGRGYGGVANFGRRPTVGAPSPLLETHLFDFNGDLYGKNLRVEFVDFIRDEVKFDGLNALAEQIKRDCATARAVLSRPR